MKFEKMRAIDLIRKHNLDPSTFYVWRHRDAIPDRYDRRKKYVKREAITAQQVQQVNEILSVRWICWKYLTLDHSQLSAHKANRYNLSKQTHAALEEELRKVGLLMYTYIRNSSKYELYRLLTDKRIKKTVMVSVKYYRFFQAISKCEDLPRLVQAYFKQAITEHYMQLSQLITDLPTIEVEEERRSSSSSTSMVEISFIT